MYNNVIISGTGSAIPTKVVKNADFKNHVFLNEDGSLFEKENSEIIEKFNAITGIEERRYAEDSVNTSDLATQASEQAIQSSGINKEDLDLIIVAHNFGDVKKGSIQGDMLPSLATRVKNKLGIVNPNCVAYDILFGCPGWVQGMIQANQAIKAGDAKKVLVIGAETLSRVVDHSDRDSMIFADGAGATILELKKEDKERGILTTAAQTYALEEAGYLYSGPTFNQELDQDINYIKMLGRKIYEFALTKVPAAIKVAMDKRGLEIDDISKVFLHQANEKMDEAIIKRLYRLYRKPVKGNVMPMSIQKLGNNSVATVPILYDMVLRNQLEGHSITTNDIVVFASVGAGMNINAITYKV
ncbi:3-oxoacyl-ACP synthase III family protein [Wenyingzhuangia aestuarii]|uniref:3-oxoacyl-ACP synthase III family protein n=1 Tax=Wenyingzhuangia aestuarii TaxID=1647582 RepID=UPI00143B2050|nr:ketoacyl-ACP synthase III [Wenyingzhuangia aestuarii]NJB82627.1 3-oxoacyl-[acyl-carrier-protein] synthase-3 [Wenyingzhuangia aestuarii]